MFTPSSMGYDRAITIFSPDGKLYQVEYAFEAVRKGWTTLGIKCNSGVILAAEKRRTVPLMDVSTVEKIFKVDDHIGVTFAGLAADGRILVDYARLRAIQHRLLYDEPIPVETLTKRIGDVKQSYTQHGGVRPFGVALIIGGVDDGGPHLFMTEPSGQYLGYMARAVGIGEGVANDFLERNYKPEMSIDEAIILAIQSLLKTSEKGLTADSLEIGYVDAKDRKFKKLSHSEIEGYLSKASSEGI